MDRIAGAELDLIRSAYQSDDQREVVHEGSRVTSQLLGFSMGRSKTVQDHLTTMLAGQAISGEFSLTVYRNRAILETGGSTVTLYFPEDCSETVDKVKAFRFREGLVGGSAPPSPPSPPIHKALPPPPPPMEKHKDPLAGFSIEEKRAYRSVNHKFLGRYTAVSLRKRNEFNAADVKVNLEHLLVDMHRLKGKAQTKPVKDLLDAIRENAALVLKNISMLREAPGHALAMHNNDRAEVDRLARDIVAFKY